MGVAYIKVLQSLVKDVFSNFSSILPKEGIKARVLVKVESHEVNILC